MVEQKPNYSEVRNVGIEGNDENYLPQTYSKRAESLYANDDANLNLKDFIIGAFVGGVVGAATALFLAPKAGKELRSDVAVQASQLKEKSAGFTSTAKEKTVELSKKVQAQSGQLVDKVKSLKSTTTPPFDDGTVSYEGEEPLDIMETMEKTIAEYENEQKEQAAAGSTKEKASSKNS
ncbi:YtxH domain-containing protein [Rummeliibacillus sp. JY-2-4R]